MKHYDLIVIGTGQSGEKAAVKAAYFGYNVAIVEKSKIYGGATVVTGTLPSKALKETTLQFSGKYENGLYGIERDLSREATIEDFMSRKNFVTKTEHEAIKRNLDLHKVDIYSGVASFEDNHVIKIASEEGVQYIHGVYIIIATGAFPFHPSGIPFDGIRVHDFDSILKLTHFPKSICIVGASAVGCEYSTIFSTLGTKVYLVNDKNKILPFADHEIVGSLISAMHKGGITTYFNTKIQKLDVPEKRNELIQVTLENGEKFEVDMFLLGDTRHGNIKDLNCEKIKLKTGLNEMILVDQTYRTNVSNIYAVGDVIGFPALASTSSDQGRIAVAYIFKTKDLEHLPSFFPYGIYTIPEVSMVGMTEDFAEMRELNYCVAKAKYTDMARGKIMDEKSGYLKLIFDRDSLQVLGVHIIGNIATEIIHYGVTLVEDRKNLYDIIGTVFNYPTLHDLYKYAAYDGISTITGYSIKE